MNTTIKHVFLIVIILYMSANYVKAIYGTRLRQFFIASGFTNSYIDTSLFFFKLIIIFFKKKCKYYIDIMVPRRHLQCT